MGARQAGATRGGFRVEKMRICLVSRELVPFFGGGIGTYSMLMARALRDAGHEVHVLTADHLDLARRSQSLFPGITVHGIAPSLGEATENACNYASMRHAWGVYEALERLHAAHRFEVVEFPEFYGEGYFALQAKRYLNKFSDALFIVRLHTPTEHCRQLNRQYGLDVETVFLQHQERTSIELADLVVSPTHSLLEKVNAETGPLERTAVHPHPFDMASWVEAMEASKRPDWRPEDAEPLSPLALRKQERARGRTPDAAGLRPRAKEQVLYFGRLEYRKGVAELLQAGLKVLELGRDVEFLFIGGDTHTGPFGQSMLAYLRKRIPAKWKHRFIFEARRPRLELVRAIRGATVCAFPSHWENFPNVCLEAMAAGATVVGSDQGGMAEIIEHEKSGLLVRGGDVDALVEGLVRALSDSELRERIREAAPARVVEVCDPAAAAASFVELGRDALATLRTGSATAAQREPRAGGDAPSVSIIVPFYNLGRYLPETLKSIREQTYTDYEVIVVDDGSTESASIAVLELLEGSSIRLVRKPNGGLSSARNAGVAAARGKWVLPLDADDLIAPTFLEKTVSVLERHPELGFVTALSSYFEKDPAKPFGGWIPWGGDRDCLPIINTASSCTALMPRALIEEAGGYDEWLTSFEDWDLFCSLAERGRFGVVLPEFLFHYRVRRNSMLRTTATTSRFELISYLVGKHEALATASGRTLKVLLGEQERMVPRPADPAVRPWHHRFVDGVNGAVKMLPVVHPTLKRSVSSVASSAGLLPASGQDVPLRHALADGLHSAISGALELPPAVKVLTTRIQRLVGNQEDV